MTARLPADLRRSDEAGQPLALRIEPWPDPEWAVTSRDAAPTATVRWIGLAPRRLPGDLTTFTLTEGGSPVLGVTGVVMRQPSANDRIDPFAILSGGSVHQGLAPEGPHPWRGVDPDAVYPCLLVMFPHYDCQPVGPGANSERLCTEIVRHLVDLARRSALRSVVFEYLTPEAATLLTVLRREGFHVVALADRCDLAVTWTDFDGYLAQLPSKRRISVRRELRALDEAGVTIAERRLRADETELVRLRCQLVAKYGNPVDPVKEATFFERVRTTFAPEQVSVFEASRNGTVVGFGLFVQDGDTWLPMGTGSAYDDPASRLTYFATLFYRPAALAPERGVRLVQYGLGSWAAKRSRGCRLSPMYAASLITTEHG